MIENIIAYLRNVEGMKYENDFYHWEAHEHSFDLNYKRCHIGFVIDTQEKFADVFFNVDDAYELIEGKRIDYGDILSTFEKMRNFADFLEK